MIKLEVTTHSGKDAVVEVESYEPHEIAKELSDQDVLHIVLGDRIYSRIDVKNIWPYEEEVTEGDGKESAEEIPEEVPGGDVPDEPVDSEEKSLQE